MDGLTMSVGLYRQITKVIRRVLLQDGWTRSPDDGNPRSREATRYRDRAVVLNEALNAATHSFTPTSAEASRLRWAVETDDEDNKVGRYTEHEDPDQRQLITVWNHSTTTDHAADTFGFARWIDGHWCFFGDCEALITREVA